MREHKMKSYYGNIIVDLFELVFAIVSLLFTWLSLVNDDTAMFAITALVYMLPRFLSICKGIMDNGNDMVRMAFDITSLVALFASFVMASLLVFNSATEVKLFEVHTQEVFQVAFYCLSAVSLLEFVFKCSAGISQRISLIKNCIRR